MISVHFIIGEMDGYVIYITELLRSSILLAADESERGAGSVEEIEREIMAEVEEHLDAIVFGGLPGFTVWIPNRVKTVVHVAEKNLVIDIAQENSNGN